jgi:hypothetical protein
MKRSILMAAAVAVLAICIATVVVRPVSVFGQQPSEHQMMQMHGPD